MLLLHVAAHSLHPRAAENATATSCDKKIDHSNYWVPSLYHQRPDKQFELVTWSHSAVYYQKRACDYAPNKNSCDKSFVPLAFPYGFRMVAGDPARRYAHHPLYWCSYTQLAVGDASCWVPPALCSRMFVKLPSNILQYSKQCRLCTKGCFHYVP